MLSRLKLKLFPHQPFDDLAWQRKVAQQDSSLLYAPHYDPKSRRFFNPWHKEEHDWRSIARFFLAKNHTSKEQWLYRGPRPQANDLGYLRQIDAAPSLTMLGHSSLVWQEGGHVVVFDPFFSRRAFNTPRQMPAAAKASALPADSLVLLSHNHYDHLDKKAIQQLPQAQYVCPLGMGSLLRAWGAKHVREMDWWQEYRQDFLKICCLPAHHWSRRLNQATNRSLWAAWLVEIAGRQVFFGGDSAYFVGFQEFGRCFPGIDLAILACGAYAPRWFMHLSHTDVTEMFLAFAQLQAQRLVPMHWGSITLGHEPAAWPARQIQLQLAPQPELQDKVHLLPIGGRLLL